jgi:hypothetical protein
VRLTPPSYLKVWLQPLMPACAIPSKTFQRPRNSLECARICKAQGWFCTTKCSLFSASPCTTSPSLSEGRGVHRAHLRASRLRLFRHYSAERKWSSSACSSTSYPEPQPIPKYLAIVSSLSSPEVEMTGTPFSLSTAAKKRNEVPER